MQRLAYHVATVLGLGDKLPAPGTTAGSLPAILGWWLAMVVLDDPRARLAATVIGTITVLVIGIWASKIESDRRGSGDPGPVVIDEVAGQWLSVVPALVLMATPTPSTLAWIAAAAFVLFRVFDIAKPWPVSALERLPGGVGIMADDIAAGGYAALVLGVGLAILG